MLGFLADHPQSRRRRTLRGPDFCGFGEGRVGSHTLAPGWYKGFGPRFGLAWNAMSKTVVRAGTGISYAPVKTANGTSHYAGFAQSVSFPDYTGGISPVFLLSQGMPDWPRPPFINPSLSNNSSVDWYQGREASRLPQLLNWNVNIQRELRGGTQRRRPQRPPELPLDGRESHSPLRFQPGRGHLLRTFEDVHRRGNGVGQRLGGNGPLQPES